MQLWWSQRGQHLQEAAAIVKAGSKLSSWHKGKLAQEQLHKSRLLHLAPMAEQLKDEFRLLERSQTFMHRAVQNLEECVEKQSEQSQELLQEFFQTHNPLKENRSLLG